MRPIRGVNGLAAWTGRSPVPADAHGKEAPMDRQTLSIMKACEVVGVSRRTIYNWISAGKVEYVRTAGGSIRIFADSLWRTPAVPTTDGASAATHAVTATRNT
jgi:excisionase family DNA binding protein